MFSLLSSLLRSWHKSSYPIKFQILFLIKDFNNDNISVCTENNYISALHCNIRSINANFDSLSQMLHQLNHNFSITGLSETRINLSKLQFATPLSLVINLSLNQLSRMQEGLDFMLKCIYRIWQFIIFLWFWTWNFRISGWKRL